MYVSEHCLRSLLFCCVSPSCIASAGVTPADLVVLVPTVCVVSCLLPFLLRHAIHLLRLETNYSASGPAASSPLHKHRPRPMSSEAAAPHLVASPSPLPVDGVSPHLLRLQSILLAPLEQWPIRARVRCLKRQLLVSMFLFVSLSLRRE